MCLRNDAKFTSLTGLVAACVVSFTASAMAGSQDDVAAYLQSHGLKQLLLVHLEQQRDKATGDERDALIRRLVELYAELLESATDPAQRVSLEERARSLLEQAPANTGDELRLALLRATYRGAEKIAENHRLRLSNEQDVQRADQTFEELLPKLATMRQRLKQALEGADRRASRGTGGGESPALNEAVDRSRSLYAQCTFLNAWTLYYHAWLSGRREGVRNAEQMFGEIIAPDIAVLDPAEVSVDLRSIEAVARSILGMALCKSLSSSAATAASWVALLEHPNAYEPLRAQATAWKIAVHLQQQEYQEVRDLIEVYTATGSEVPVLWLRLIAAQVLEDRNRNRHGDALMKLAITQLASRGELDQVLDLAGRYGTEPLGDRGFALKYVNGVIKYREARAAHGNENPSADPRLAELYEQAGAVLRSALDESDANSYATAAVGCRRLVAWCLYFQSRFLDARSAFEQSAAGATDESAAESLWMAIVSLDRVVEVGGNAELQNQHLALIQTFIDRFPSNSRTPQLRLRLTVAQKTASPEAVAQLLAIPERSDVYASAQRRAADLLYQLVRGASGQQRLEYANQYLAIASPLIGPAARNVDMANADTAAGFVVRCRQILEVALTEGVQRPGAARSALEALEYAKSVGTDLTAFNDEIDCRRVQERLLFDDATAAAQVADELWNRDQRSIWTRIAARAMFKFGHKLWKNPESTPAQARSGVELVVRYGGRVLHEFKDDSNGIDQPGAIGYYAAVAEATMHMWELTADADKANAALFLFDKLLDKRPNNSSFLRSTAVLSEKLGKTDKALDCWRRLVNRAGEKSPMWYEAEYHLILLLAKSDPVRAREVMDQHKHLNPDYGPDPWGALLEGLDQSIPQREAPTTNLDAAALIGESDHAA